MGWRLIGFVGGLIGLTRRGLNEKRIEIEVGF